MKKEVKPQQAKIIKILTPPFSCFLVKLKRTLVVKMAKKLHLKKQTKTTLQKWRVNKYGF